MALTGSLKIFAILIMLSHYAFFVPSTTGSSGFYGFFTGKENGCHFGKILEKYLWCANKEIGS
jgi:hypothetical protein